MTLTQEYVRYLFSYEDGNLVRNVDQGLRFKRGSIAGRISGNGYYCVGIDRKVYMLHRVIFLWHNGWLPAMIDHIDRDPSNNRIENLRPCTPAQNQCNRKSVPSVSSKYKGVSWNSAEGKWRAQCKFKGVWKYIGSYESEDEAALAYNEYAKSVHGDFFVPNVVSGVSK